MKHLYMLFSIIAILFCSVTSATELGVIYYHETMMTSNGEHYIARTPEGVATDMQNIDDIAQHVKLFVNPYVDANTVWTDQVNTIAKEHGMHTTITVMVDDRKLTNENWADYRTRVLALCAHYNGKADEFHVGNEIILHSTDMTREQIRDNVIELMQACRAVFSGQVSYQELWWSHQVWVGNPEKIYFMTYENFDTFQGIMAELQAQHPNAAIGEWGEDLLEDATEHDEAWQKDQIQKRWEIIQNANIPVAYLFTYREPSWNGFGMLRPQTDQRRPLWEVFGASLNWDNTTVTAPTPPVTPPAAPPVNNSQNNTDPVPHNTTAPENPPQNTTPETNQTTPETNSSVDTTVEEPAEPEPRRRSGGGGSRSFARKAAPERTYDFVDTDAGMVVYVRENRTKNETRSTAQVTVELARADDAERSAARDVDRREPDASSVPTAVPDVPEPQPEARLARETQAPSLPPPEPGLLVRVWRAITSFFG